MKHVSIKVIIMNKPMSTYERKMQDKKFKDAYEKYYKELLFSDIKVSNLLAKSEIEINPEWAEDMQALARVYNAYISGNLSYIADFNFVKDLYLAKLSLWDIPSIIPTLNKQGNITLRSILPTNEELVGTPKI